MWNCGQEQMLPDTDLVAFAETEQGRRGCRLPCRNIHAEEPVALLEPSLRGRFPSRYVANTMLRQTIRRCGKIAGATVLQEIPRHLE
jgi:hypothetical protein